MSISELIRSMQAAGAPMAAILIAVEAIEAVTNEVSERKRKERERKQRQRDKSRDSHGTVTGHVPDNSSPLVPPSNGFPHPSLTPPYNPPILSDDDCSARVKKIFSWLETFFNSPIPYHSAPINAWLSWQADFELDIKPAAERYKKRKQEPPRALSWLDDDIAKSIKQRNKPMPEVEISNGQRNYGHQPNKSDRAKAAILRGLGTPG